MRGTWSERSLLGTLKDMLIKAMEWASLPKWAPLLWNMDGHSFLRAFETKRYIKRCVKSPVSFYLSIGSPLGNVERIRLPARFERKGKYIWVPFLEPEDIRVLSLGVIWNFGKGTGALLSWYQILGHKGPFYKAYVHQDRKASNPMLINQSLP